MAIKPYKKRISEEISELKQLQSAIDELPDTEKITRGHRLPEDYWDIGGSPARFFNECGLDPRNVESYIMATIALSHVHYTNRKADRYWTTSIREGLIEAVEQERNKSSGLSDRDLCVRLHANANKHQARLKAIDPSEKLFERIVNTKSGSALYRQYRFARR